MTGHNVSHANNRTKRRFNPNLQKKRIKINGRVRRVWVSTRFLRTLSKKELKGISL
jgi:large subunit ribosomal protein L28